MDVARFRLQQATEALRSKEKMMDRLDAGMQGLKLLLNIGAGFAEVMFISLIAKHLTDTPYCS